MTRLLVSTAVPYASPEIVLASVLASIPVYELFVMTLLCHKDFTNSSDRVFDTSQQTIADLEGNASLLTLANCNQPLQKQCPTVSALYSDRLDLCIDFPVVVERPN